MMYLITYDINTKENAGKVRLRKIAKECIKYGQRVQLSVFECKLDARQYRALKATLTAMIDEEKDSIRFYRLGDNYRDRLDIVGRKHSYNPEDFLFI